MDPITFSFSVMVRVGVWLPKGAICEGYCYRVRCYWELLPLNLACAFYDMASSTMVYSCFLSLKSTVSLDIRREFATGVFFYEFLSIGVSLFCGS